ncbi:MAG: ABC transporter ATP-binding protein [Natronomonas sp.]|jgi:thiamine transport system ATP-binding protein|uniref:Molybdate/tungstate import ATP-binding protein WtpC n=1 Tax=Natronomonas salsuginis TaxID=2217661 RepID=A0A4U5JAG2_9EURY|nr:MULTISPECIES: ABC transporter ATP-binding protein [Natronomonas]MDR9381135.1 ABC transporter ATP-binding protein [Natronomonas sp.]MDR9430223.1 ABC transporter ATP-binding protein [Natronomonas sp.]TKR26150.1 ABC transporter ATP-binding protein [Natronomonas salsuginis]
MRVELDGVSKRYGETTALESASITVEDGEFFTLVGPSGCGKTTTLRLLAGFEEPTEGAIRFDGESVAGTPPEDRSVGLVFQSYALFPHMSVAENVAYGLNFADPPDGVSTDERVVELLELVGLSGFDDRDPSELSGGQQQRVALARALAPGPDLLLLDEPMSALDARLRQRLRRELREIQRNLEITTVYVTHDQAEALAVSDRLAVLSDGTVEQTGEPTRLYRRPESRFVADFLGENNVFEAEVCNSTGTGERGQTRTVVRVDGREFELATDGAITGGVTFCVRPSAFGTDVDRNRITGDVLDSEFLGETVRARLSWRDRRLVVSLSEPPASDELTVGFDPADAWIIGEEASGNATEREG